MLNALIRTSSVRKVSREPLAGVKRQQNGSELVFKQLAEPSRWSRGLAVNRQEGIDVNPYLLRAYREV
jgi:hypothetical protein